MAKLIHTMIRVHDLERSLRFYRDAFDLEISHRLDFPDFTLAYLRNAQTDAEIELTWNRGRAERYSHGDGYGHVAFCVDDARSKRERLIGLGLAPNDMREFRHDNGELIARYFFIQDPDGYKIEVLERYGHYPVERHANACIPNHSKETNMQTKVIPIAHGHDDHTVPVAMKIPLTRRELLKGTGIITGTLAFSSIFAALAPSRVWAVELQGLDSHQGEVILAFTRQVYPHPKLDDAVYALVVKDLDGKARKDPAVQQQLAAGVQRLDAIGGSNWARRDAADQARDVESMASTPFFNTVRSTAVVSLYSNTLAYAHFGYGASEGDGGYLYKGFDNLSWLPNPPAADSGPIPSDS